MPGLEGISLGRYRLQRRLGRGGMAEVYLATDERMHRDVAVKIVSSNQSEYAERFSREAQAMGNLHHEHILPAYDVGEQEPWHYLVMPYVERGTLSDLIKRKQGPLDLAHAGEILQQIASGLHYAHQRGFIHRDIKPSNILMRDDHHAYLADFGLARALEGGGDLTQTGTLLGTPEYMAPELAEGPANTSSDIYALAVVLYQMICGRVPFRGDTAISVFWKHMREQPQPPSQYNPAIPRAVDQVLMRALDKDPARRYATPLALSQAYQKAINELEEIPSLYDTAEIVETSQPVAPVIAPVQREATSTPPQPEKIFLPGERIGQTPSGAGRSYSAPVAPTPVQNFEQTTDQLAPRSVTYPPIPRRRRSNRVIAGIIMGLAFLLIVSGLLAYLTLQTRQQNATTATATARVGATNTVVAKQTSLVLATQGARTAVAATATAQDTANRKNKEATATAITGGSPLLNDPLSGSDANGWPNDGSNCSFSNNAYYVTANGSNILQPCIAARPQYSDAAIQVDVTLISSADAGLVFRANASQNQFYDFEITNQGQFYLRYFDNSKSTSLIPKTASSSIEEVGTKNTLLVIARGTDLQLFINGTFVGEIQDSTFSNGQVGVAAGTLSANVGDASFTNMRVYPIS